MSEQIIQRVISAENDKRLVLFNSQCARPLSIGSNWTYLRIGIRYGVQGTATVAPVRLFVGLTSGVDHVWASDYCTHAAGMLMYATSATYNATGGGNLALGQGVQFFKKVSQTETNAGTNYIGSSGNYLACDAPNKANVWFLDLKKLGGTTWQAYAGGPTALSAGYLATKSYDLLRAAMLAVNETEAYTILGVGPGTVRTGTVNEAVDGYLDSLCVYWKHPTVGLEISDLVVARLA